MAAGLSVFLIKAAAVDDDGGAFWLFRGHPTRKLFSFYLKKSIVPEGYREVVIPAVILNIFSFSKKISPSPNALRHLVG